MTNVNYEVEYPSDTAENALHDAQEAERNLPFRAGWTDITLHRFWDGTTDMVTNASRDDDVLQAFREKEWAWVATLKAKGQTI